MHSPAALYILGRVRCAPQAFGNRGVSSAAPPLSRGQCVGYSSSLPHQFIAWPRRPPGARHLPMQHIYIADYQRLFILIGTTSVFTSTQNVGTNAMCCISQLCIYVLYRLLSAILRNVRYQIQRVD